MHNEVPKLSIIIPCYNEEKTIRQVIINAEKSLLNLNIDYEIVVVDDCSNDASSKKKRNKYTRFRKYQIC